MKKFIFILLVLSGCAASGEQFKIVDPVNSKATLIVYRLEPLSLTPYTIAINGIDSCRLHHEAYFTKIIDAGQITISTSYWSMPGTSRITFDAKNGNIYYIRVTHNTENSLSSSFGGIIGQEIYQSASDEPGPMKFYLMNNDIAKQELAETNQDCQ